MTTRTICTLGLALISTCLFSPDALGQRKGFVIGVGVGPGITSYTYEAFGATSDRETKITFMSDFKIGFAPSNDLALYWMSKVSWFSTETVIAGGDKIFFTNGFGGLGATYALKSVSPSFFLNGGLGFSTWSAPLDTDRIDSQIGLGLVLGVEYEFAKHWILDFDLLWGKPSDESLTTNVIGFKLTLNYFHY